MSKKSALGRGLGALISDASEVNIAEIDILNIEANPYQPRTQFDEDALNELAQSIKQIGIVQPITVRSIGDGKYQLIAGERRFRASKIIDLKSIPAYVRCANDDTMLELALVENIQRENLDAIEVSLSYQRLIDECNLTQDELSEKVGKKRSTVANYLRLLKLPVEIQMGIRDKKISMGHARSILGIEESDTQLMIYNQILKYGFSVRKVEEVVRELNNPTIVVNKLEKKEEKKANFKMTKEFEDLQFRLSDFFKSSVKFKCNTKGDGNIVIPFKSDEDLERILEIFDKLN